MDELAAALACALALTDLPMPDALPHWEQRELTKQEWAMTNRPRGARAMYDFRRWTIVSPPNDWSGLVHEMVHHLEYSGGFKFSEKRAEAAERRADECPK